MISSGVVYDGNKSLGKQAENSLVFLAIVVVHRFNSWVREFLVFLLQYLAEWTRPILYHTN